MARLGFICEPITVARGMDNTDWSDLAHVPLSASKQWGGSRGNDYDLLISKDSLPQVKPKFCYQKNSEWMTGSQNNSWPWQLDSLFLRECRRSQKKILLTAFSQQESHVQKFKGIERRGNLVPVREIELWVREVKELRGKCGFLSFPWKYKSEMAPVLKKPLAGNSWSHKPIRSILQHN